MPRLDRLQSILVRLQAKRVVTARELAACFGVSIRSIYRDLRTLEEAGIPIGAEAGIGYFLPDNYHLPPVMFTPTEASALLLGGKLTQSMTDESMGRAFDEALSKIKAILRSSDKEAIENVENLIEVYHSADHTPRKLFLLDIQHALANQQVLHLHYKKQDATEAEQRLIEPAGLCYYGGNWHLIAWCRLRHAYRDFRTDRIEKLVITHEIFNRTSHPTLREYFAQHIPDTDLHSITIEFDTSYLNNIYEVKYGYGFTGAENRGATTIMHFLNHDLKGFAKWLLYSGSHARIIAPDDLKVVMKQLISELTGTHLTNQ